MSEVGRGQIPQAVLPARAVVQPAGWQVTHSWGLAGRLETPAMASISKYPVVSLAL